MNYEQILADQKEELGVFAEKKLCPREEEACVDLDSPLAQIVIGVRRSGKSTLCYKVLNEHHVNYAYVNFDDERLYGIEAKELNTLLESLYVVYGEFQHLFLDEVQNVHGWHLFVNRLLRKGVRILLTGSNAKLLSSELSTHLTGRFNQIELYPFSFSEVRLFKERKTAVSTVETAEERRDYIDYETRGGFPEIQNMVDPRQYVKSLFDSILLRDILQRFSIKYTKAFTDIAVYALQNYCREINYASVARTFGIRSVHTVQNYISFLEQAYVLIPLHKFSFKPKIRIRQTKLYVVDVGFVSYASDITATGPDRGWRMENIVFLELYRHRRGGGFELYYYKQNYEIDFILFKSGKIVQLIQVSYDITDEKTRKRELSALVKGSADLHCDSLLLITQAEEGSVEVDDKRIEIVPITKWLRRWRE